tara:strand:- start:2418 stop:4826 length:2409 start_codon:yes stop_codon:yes gene_type:complete
MKKAILSLVCSMVLSLSYSQTKDKDGDGHYFLPSELSSYVDTDLMNDLYNGIKSLNSLNFNTQTPWVVFSDRSKNKTMNAANSTFPFGSELEFMEPLFVTEVKGSWLRVQKISERVNGKLKKSVDVGWLHADKTVLTRYPVLNEFKSTRKAMALISLNIETIEIEQLEQLRNEYVLYEDPDGKKNRGIANKFQIFYILKELNGYTLLSPTDELDNNREALKVNVAGWMQTIRTTPWDSKICLEPNSGKMIEMQYEGKTADVFDSKESLYAWHRSSHKNLKGRVKSFPLGDTLLPPSVMRMPILSTPESNDKQTVKVATVGNPNESSVTAQQRVNLQIEIQELSSKSKDVNVVFVIDGTSSMHRYYTSVANSIDKIFDDSKTLATGARLRFGAIIYRDYADKPDDVEVFPLTANKRDISQWLMDVDCFSNVNDIDKPEAQYNGIINGLDKVGMNENQSNVVVLIGDAGNHDPDPEALSVEQAISIMSRYQTNFISFQVIDDGSKAYNRFNRDAKKYLMGLSMASVKNEKITPKLVISKNFKNTYEIKFVSSDGKDYTNLHMFGLFTFAPDRIQMSTEILEEGIRDALSNYIEQLNDRIQLINGLLSGRTSANKLDPQVIPIFCEKCFSESNSDYQRCVKLLSNVGDFSFIGYTDMKLYGDRNVYKPVVFVSYKELSSLQDKFSRLTSPMLTNSQKRQRIFDAIVGLMKVIKDDPIDIIEDKTLNEIWELILGIPFDESNSYNGLGNEKLKDLRSNRSQEFNDFLEDVSVKSKNFNATKFRGNSFEVSDQRFFWIPLSEFPGNG